jgi:ribosomal protein S18 acetylase RimI-like enzyme
LDLFVEEGVRGRGCGTALILAVMRHTVESGGTWLCFHVSPDNKRAIKLYRRLGAHDFGQNFMGFDRRAFRACLSMHASS